MRRIFKRQNTIQLNIFPKENMISFLLCIYMYLNILKLFEITLIYELLSLAIAFPIGLLGILKGNKISFDKNYFFILGIILLLYIILQIANSRSAFNSIYILTNGLILHTVLRNKLNSTFFYINYWCICLIFLRYLYSGQTANSILFSASQNVVSFNIFINLVLLHCIEYINSKKLSVLPVLLLVILSIWAVGRAGIIASIAYLIFIMYYTIKDKKLWLKIGSVAGIFIFGMMTYTMYQAEINNIIDIYFRKFSEENSIDYSEDPRMEFVKIYLNNMNPLTFFFGYNYDSEPYFLFWSKNPHNSFIRAHSFFGFLSFPFFLFLFLRLIKMIRKKEIFFFAVLILLLFRANMDSFFFFGPYDFIVFFLLLYGFQSKYLNLRIC